MDYMRNKLYYIFFVPFMGLLLLTFNLAPRVSFAAPIRCTHLYILSSGHTMNEAIEGNNGEVRGELVGQCLTAGKSYTVVDNLAKGCGGVDPFASQIVTADLNGRFLLPFDIKGPCTQNKYKIEIERVDDIFITHSVKFDLDAPGS